MPKTARKAPMNVKAVRVPEKIRPLLERIGQRADELHLKVYAVGGCVRDWLLGTDHVADVDVVVEGDCIAFSRAIAQMVGGSVVSHEQFGTATVVMPAAPAKAARRADASMIRIDVA